MPREVSSGGGEREVVGGGLASLDEHGKPPAAAVRPDGFDHDRVADHMASEAFGLEAHVTHLLLDRGGGVHRETPGASHTSSISADRRRIRSPSPGRDICPFSGGSALVVPTGFEPVSPP